MGKLLDPLADKLLINSAFIMLIPLGRVPAWMVVLIVAREVAVTGLRGIASLEGLAIAASKWGKAKMIFQTIALIGLMLHYEYLGINFHSLGMLILWIALAITIWSGVDYFIKFYREHRKTRVAIGSFVQFSVLKRAAKFHRKMKVVKRKMQISR